MGNDTQTVSLVEFLLARIAEDEAANRAAAGANNQVVRVVAGAVDGEWEADASVLLAEHYRRYNSARVLAECEAKRRIVEDAKPYRDLCGSDDWFGGAERIHRDVIRLLALPYADHPDYRDEWRP